jgi:hypothetical protein
VFAQPLESFPRRKDHPPLLTAGALFEALRHLLQGSIIPPNCYINDYDIGTIPSWTILRREGDYRFLFVVIDPNPVPTEPNSFPVALNIIGTPSTVLATPFYVLKEGFGPRGMACSLPQQAWVLVRNKMPAKRKRENIPLW